MTYSQRAQEMGCSAELVDGIRRYEQRIASLGGYGVRVRATARDGVEREGVLAELGAGGCQPCLVQDDGRRFAVDLDRVTRI